MTQNAWFRCTLCAAISGEISILIQTGAESWGRFPVPRICRWESITWFVHLDICESDIPFKVDTGADISVISQSVWESLTNKPTLKPTEIKLNCINGPLKARGEFTTIKQRGNVDFRFKIVVVETRNTSCLLARDVAAKMGLVIHVDETKGEADTSVPGPSVGLLKTHPEKMKLHSVLRWLDESPSHLWSLLR